MHLYLVRHADSNFGASTDHQRPLSELGVFQANSSANYLKQKVNSNRVRIICSDALRTFTTAQIIHQTLAQKLTIRALEQQALLYQASVGDWCDVITTHQDAEHLIIVGHNPTMSYLSQFLNDQQIINFSPSTVAYYQLEIAADGLKLPVQYIDLFKPNAIQ